MKVLTDRPLVRALLQGRIELEAVSISAPGTASGSPGPTYLLMGVSLTNATSVARVQAGVRVYLP